MIAFSATLSTIAAAPGHRYWRVFITTTPAGAPIISVAEFQFRTTAGVSRSFSGGAPSASTIYPSGSTFDASQAADGNSATFWASDSAASPPQWWAYDYGAGNALSIVEMTVMARPDANYSQAPIQFIPQWSDDGSTWTSMSVVNPAPWTAVSQVQTFAVTPLPSAKVVLLCHFDGTNGSTAFVDSAGGHTLTATNATVNTASPKFGAGEGDFTAGTNASIDTGNATDFNFINAQFTVETQAYFTATPGLCAMLSQWDSASLCSWWLGMNAGALTFFYSTTGSDVTSLTAAFSPTLNTWYHIAVDRDASNVLRLYVNGVVQNSATASSPFFASTKNCRIGNDYIATRGFAGHLDEARITIGLAQYGGPFTPPTAAFGGGGSTVDLAGNLGAPSSYGKLSYGLKLYSRINAFTPIFAANFDIVGQAFLTGDLAPSVTFAGALSVQIDLGAGDLAPAVAFNGDATFDLVLSGDLAPQIALGGSLSLDLPLTVLGGGLTPNVVLGASSFVSEPLWADAEPCPSPPWASSEPCPPSLWTPVDPCVPVDWEESVDG